MVRVSGNTIVMTRSDTAEIVISIVDENEEEYIPQETDVIRFAVKKNYSDDDQEVLIYKEIPHDTMLLRIDSSDTKFLEMPGTYRFDIEIRIDDGTEEGFVSTFITNGRLKIKEEII